MPRLARARLAALAASCALAGAVAACATPPPRSDLASSQAEVNRALAAARTEGQLTEFTGVQTRICLEVSPSARLCEWQLAKRNYGWPELARALSTEDRINLLCLLPADGSYRSPDSCTAFPQRSNRYLYEMPYSGPASPTEKRDPRAEARARYQQQASAELARAQTLMQLVGLMGAAPDSCADLGDGTRGCAWFATSATYGHGTLAFSVPASTEDRVRMRCVLPADGSPRAGGSCHLEVPGRIAHSAER
jgi:hypothetical protein